jgi:hypothetical protein
VGRLGETLKPSQAELTITKDLRAGSIGTRAIANTGPLITLNHNVSTASYICLDLG